DAALGHGRTAPAAPSRREDASHPHRPGRRGAEAAGPVAGPALTPTRPPMSRGLVLLTLAATAPAAAAQAPPVPPVKLTLRPAPAPVPALKYQLLPELRDRTPGNAAVLYYRAFTPEWQAHRRPGVSEKIYKWADDPRQPPGPDLAWVADS